MTTENWIQLISIFVAIITASLSYVYTEHSKRIDNEKRIKEKFYLEYVESANNTAEALNNPHLNTKEQAQRQLEKSYNQILLIGSVDVIKSLIDFHKYLEIVNSGIESFDFDKHNRLYTALLKSIRIDLYKQKTINRGYPTIHLLVSRRKS